MQRQDGFGLIEVMLAFVIVAATASTLLQLNKTYLEYSRDGRSREVAMRLAESKLDELRRFQNRIGFIAITNGTDSVNLNNIEYERTWAVTDYAWNNAWVTPSPSEQETIKKQVTVIINWNDGGEALSFALESEISSNISAISGPFGTALGMDSAGKSRAEVEHTPGALPDVVPIDLGGGLKQETSKPLITVAKNDSTSVRVSEKTTIYDASNNKVQEQDLETVSCNCKLSGTASPQQPAQRTLLGNFSYWKKGEESPSQINTGVPKNKDQDDFCDLCCKNHFDVPNGDFSHWYDAIKAKNNAHTHTSTYKEACRLVRLDGYFFVASDWNLVTFDIFPKDFFINNKAKYQEYFKKVVIEYVRAQIKDGANYNVAGYTLPVDLGSFYKYLGEDNEISVVPSTNTELEAKGIYVDIISPEYRESLLSRMEDGEDTSLDKLLASDFFQFLPWEPPKDLSDRVAWHVDSEDVASINTGGELQAGGEGETTVTASILRSNSGLTTNTPISPFEEDNDWITAELTVEVTAAP
ncbi:type IV pilus modification PilV family protein [Oceanimonas smirnovii]|uniref:type IV pilus modification PilV family protein n=1 Tax=Oceanimonas smirnovii TaxID=264574 RepID=UPI00037935A0|nr:type II secretion system protein [Oceanimonas smirnovii]